MRREPCPVDGCLDPKARGHLMCRHHWRMVPAAMRQAVNSAWKVVKSVARHTPETYLGAVRRWQDTADAAKAEVTRLEGMS